MAEHRITWVPCVECVDNREYTRLRDADVVCLVCGRAYCAGHIAQHLGQDHNCDLGAHSMPTRVQRAAAAREKRRLEQKGVMDGGEAGAGSERS